MLRPFGPGIVELTLDSVGLAVLLELHTEVRSVRRILLLPPQIRSLGKRKIYGRVVAADIGVWRKFFNPRHDLVTFVVEFLKVGQPKRMRPVATVRSPVSHLFGIKRRLRPTHRRTPKARRFAGDWIFAIWISEIGMEGEPKR